MHGGHGTFGAGLEWLLLAPLTLAAVLYLMAAATQPRTGARAWPAHRSMLWLLGLATIAAAALGPRAAAAPGDVTAHLTAHFLIGMLAPLLMVLSAPVTLALRALDVRRARRLSRALSCRPARVLTHPLTAATVNVGSLWALYATPLSDLVRGDPALHYLLLAHFFLAGYLFTASLIGLDPAPHRSSFSFRLVVLVLAIAAHSILAKHLYSHPPPGTPTAQAERAAILMYYGGDLLELALVVLFCAQWYRASSPQRASKPARTAEHKQRSRR
jgi:putative membrane protein